MTDNGRRQVTGGGARRRVAAWALPVVAAAALGLAAAWLVGGGGWFVRGLTSRLSLVCWVTIMACLSLLFVIWGAMWRAGLARRLERRSPRSQGDRGTVMLEFAMVLPIALMLVLLMIQSAILMVGNLCVHYSAYCAARTAIVAIPDGPRQPDHNLPPEGEGPNILEDYYYSAAEGTSAKANRIWRAAVWAVLPVSAASRDIPEADAGSLITGLDRFFAGYGADRPWWADDVIARKLRYAEDYTAVDISPPAAGDRYAPNEDVTVRVEHVLYLSVPYANRIFSLLEGGQELDFGAAERGTLIRASCTLTNEGVQDYVEHEAFPG